MFERQVAELLRTYLGEYIDGLDNESLNVRVWKGAWVTLHTALVPSRCQCFAFASALHTADAHARCARAQATWFCATCGCVRTRWPAWVCLLRCARGCAAL
jgi:hypothetical protein